MVQYNSCFMSSCNCHVAFCHDNEHMQFAASGQHLNHVIIDCLSEAYCILMYAPVIIIDTNWSELQLEINLLKSLLLMMSVLSYELNADIGLLHPTPEPLQLVLVILL